MTNKTLEELLEPQTGWWISHDGDRFHSGPFSEKQAAVEEAREVGATTIAFMTERPIRLSDCFSARKFFEDTERDPPEDWYGEFGDSILVFSPEQLSALEEAVRKVIDRWQEDHQLSPLPDAFSVVEQLEEL